MRFLLLSSCALIVLVAISIQASAQNAVRGSTPALSGPMTPAPAAPAPDQTEARQKARMTAAMANNPNGEKLEEMAQNLYNSLTQVEDQRLVEIRNGFGMIRVAQTVRDDIGGTVTLCDKANPSMKKDMDGHFVAWQAKVMTVTAAQEQAMQDSINNRNFGKPQEIRDFLAQLDKFAGYAKQQNDKNLTRVTTPSACKSLEDSMDTTSSKIVDALHKITWPGQG